MLSKKYHQLKKIYEEYPAQFWVIVGSSFIDHLGGALLLPFFSLYITRKFDVGLTQVGILFMIFSVTGMLGTTIGGALTDYLGRKRMIIMGLVVSGVTSLCMGLVNSLPVFYVMGAVVGLFADAAGPARRAMMADILPESQRADGFGIMRVMMNLAVTIGPAVGGLLASVSYLLLFAIDTATSLITAVIVARTIRESHPSSSEQEAGGSLKTSLQGYKGVLHNRPFMLFLLFSLISTLVYTQMYSSLSVFLRDVHMVPEQGFGMIMSINAGLVVLFQFPVTRRIKHIPSLQVMAAGAILYAVGFGMYGFVGSYGLFVLAMVVITVGEMLVAPTGEALAASFAPEDMRGRYMAVMGFSWMIPSAVGPLGAGLIMDNLGPNLIWYLGAVLGCTAAGGFLWLGKQLPDRGSRKEDGLNVQSRTGNPELHTISLEQDVVI